MPSWSDDISTVLNMAWILQDSLRWMAIITRDQSQLCLEGISLHAHRSKSARATSSAEDTGALTTPHPDSPLVVDSSFSTFRSSD
ncbi:hypothetical protein MPTK1_6g13100 [Marchantia polymorpha subsp. ruderalis]|uniref:Uncharacterized protein n=2 Tax=Marchantia polymorpha TaxID=3197 RepID=A0AAF6BRJ7_MARPO|nr:hypothetical protein MARPO_0059s0040 [Marchantia polymorpha]BBN14631.1 hypothetical protein Mp_6g13100 [Marchantia polymorpha subsp. ruderalis]|eukprot:PTQ37092.1 hypothetical protein MARPO_0059s0040 [Marchantia polymorpha]